MGARQLPPWPGVRGTAGWSGAERETDAKRWRTAVAASVRGTRDARERELADSRRADARAGPKKNGTTLARRMLL